MKKFFALLLVCGMIMTALTGCLSVVTGFPEQTGGITEDKTEGVQQPSGTDPSGTTDGQGGTGTPGYEQIELPAGLSGSEVAKLLLANERLNATLLKNEGDIFERGVQVMNGLAEAAIENLGARETGGVSAFAENLAFTTKDITTYEGDYIGKLETDGESFFWRDFEENNNSYDYFKNITENIVFSAKVGADLIDNVKKNVRVVDKWVAIGQTKYYLHVEENSETLIEYDAENDFLKICVRYKNADGKDVYELYRKDPKFESRMTYIPGERYEMSTINDHGEHFEDFFVADHSKGYWETYILGVMPEHYNVSYFIMKDDICYDAFYDPKNETVSLLKVMSADKETDIFNLFGSSVDLKFSGFDGIDCMEAPIESAEFEQEGKFANMGDAGEANAVLHLTNGKEIRVNDTFADGKIRVTALRAMFGAWGYTGELSLFLDAGTLEEQLVLLKTFINEAGLVCRRDTDAVMESVGRAYVDLEGIIRYYRWNNVLVTDEEGIAAAIAKEFVRFDEMEAKYIAVKDAEVLDFSNAELIELNVHFAPIAAQKAENVKMDGVNVSVGSVVLTIEDTLLYVKDEPYRISFAMVKTDGSGGLIHLEAENEQTVAYVVGESFTVSAEDVQFTLPILSEGEYTVVAYIATADGIRSSGYTALIFDEASVDPIEIERMSVSRSLGKEGVVAVTYTEITDFTVRVTSEGILDYKAFMALIGAEAFKYGTPSEDVIERQTEEDTYVELVGDETEIADGTYRIAYTLQNGEDVTEGYVYAEYVCNASDTPEQEGEQATQPDKTDPQ